MEQMKFLNRLNGCNWFYFCIKETGDGHMSVYPDAVAELDSLEDRPLNLFSSEDERKTPNRACRLFTGDAL